MAERDAVVRDIPRTERTKPTDEGLDAMPLERDGVEATGGARGGHTHDPNPGQPKEGLDRGVASEHLRSPSQGARPDGIEDAASDTGRDEDRG